ncbi:MAG: nucleotidyltransferase [Cytophagales bacterium]|nr:nucleotidyltransferase [Cytophagales bacterium]
MDINNPYYLDVLRSLNDNAVEFILVGGLAVGLHGYSRYTGDMDLWVNPTEENMDRLYTSLSKMGYAKSDVDSIKKYRDIESPTPIRLIEDDGVFKVDLMTNTFQTLYTWKECRSEALDYESEGVLIPVVHINHLINMKENTSRLDDNLKDLVDASELKKIKELEKSRKNKKNQGMQR